MTAPLARDLGDGGKLELTGEDRARFLHGMCTNDILGLAPGRGCRASMLTIKGKLLSELLVLVEADSILVLVDAAAVEKVRAALEGHLIMDDVTITDRTAEWGQIGVYGDAPPAGPLHSHAREGDLRRIVVRELGRDGVRWLGDRAAIARLRERLDARFLDEAEAEVLRVEAGEPRYGRDMGEDHLPIESRLDDTISFTKGCYLGQEVIVRATQQGRVNRKLTGLRLDGEGAAAPGTKLAHESRAEAGTITSSVVSPRFGPIALAYVHRTVLAPGTRLVAGDRGATVVELPFRQ